MAEDAKVAVRTIRSDIHKEIQKAKAEKTMSEDVLKGYESDLQKQIESANKSIDEIAQKKEEEIMKV